MATDRRADDDGQKWGSIVFGVVAIGLAGYLTATSLEPRPITKEADAGVVAGTLLGDGGASNAGPIIAIDAGAGSFDLDAGLALGSLDLDASLFPTTGGPREVKMGVVLVQFAGAEGAPNNARPKGQAKELAERLQHVAEADFHQAVNQGDSGSADDIGRIPRGVLDPPVENAVFGLPAKGVSTVIETPKGYWIVKRLD